MLSLLEILYNIVVIIWSLFSGDLYPPSDRENGEEPEWVTNEKKQFKEFRDKNGDGKMDKDEVKSWILPEDYDHVASEAKHLMSESDEDKVSEMGLITWFFLVILFHEINEQHNK